MKRATRIVALGAAVVAVVVAGGRPSRAATTVDADFVSTAARSNDDEMSLARLELSRGRSDEARSFAQRMLEDHAPLVTVLDAIAPRARARTESSAAQRLVRARLERLHGADFDQAYVLTQVTGHLAAVDAFETEVADGSDARLRAYARAALPTLREHLSVALAATKHIGGDSPLKGAR